MIMSHPPSSPSLRPEVPADSAALREEYFALTEAARARDRPPVSVVKAEEALNAAQRASDEAAQRVKQLAAQFAAVSPDERPDERDQAPAKDREDQLTRAVDRAHKAMEKYEDAQLELERADMAHRAERKSDHRREEILSKLYSGPDTGDEAKHAAEEAVRNADRHLHQIEARFYNKSHSLRLVRKSHSTLKTIENLLVTALTYDTIDLQASRRSRQAFGFSRGYRYSHTTAGPNYANIQVKAKTQEASTLAKSAAASFRLAVEIAPEIPAVKAVQDGTFISFDPRLTHGGTRDQIKEGLTSVVEAIQEMEGVLRWLRGEVAKVARDQHAAKLATKEAQDRLRHELERLIMSAKQAT